MSEELLKRADTWLSGSGAFSAPTVLPVGLVRDLAARTRELEADLARVTQELAEARQCSADHCDECGWNMKFPDGCVLCALAAKLARCEVESRRYFALRSLVGPGYPLHLFIIPGHGEIASPEAFDETCDKLASEQEPRT